MCKLGKFIEQTDIDPSQHCSIERNDDPLNFRYVLSRRSSTLTWDSQYLGPKLEQVICIYDGSPSPSAPYLPPRTQVVIGVNNEQKTLIIQTKDKELGALKWAIQEDKNRVISVCSIDGIGGQDPEIVINKVLDAIDECPFADLLTEFINTSTGIALVGPPNLRQLVTIPSSEAGSYGGSLPKFARLSPTFKLVPITINDSDDITRNIAGGRAEVLA